MPSSCKSFGSSIGLINFIFISDLALWYLAKKSTILFLKFSLPSSFDAKIVSCIGIFHTLNDLNTAFGKDTSIGLGHVFDIDKLLGQKANNKHQR